MANCEIEQLKKYTVDHKSINFLPPLVRDYAYGKSELRELYQYPLAISSFDNAIEARKQFKTDRTVLTEVLNEQYSDLPNNGEALSQIEKLKNEDTFAITTAHQPNIFTGPLYSIYKIIGAINLSEQLKARHPDKHFVPFFWMGGEDHDLEEMNHINFFGEKLEWKTDQRGSVGRMSSEGIDRVIDKIREELGEWPFGGQLVADLKEAYSQTTVSAATQYLVHRWFGQYGLVVINADNKKLKQNYAPILKRELLENIASTKVNPSIEKLDALGYKAQATPREINIFYLSEGSRERIVWENEKYHVLNTSLTFTKDEMLAEVNAHPERFSPNVFLRPVYQEFTLPNLAYVGGSGELSYWLELKAEFEELGVPYPVLIPRNSVGLMDGNTCKKINKLGLERVQLFEKEVDLIKQYVQDNSTADLELTTEKQQIQAVYDTILQKAKAIDSTLEASVMGQLTGQLKALESMEKKLLRAEKRNFDVATQQIHAITEKLFPNGAPQERVENALPYLARFGRDWIGMVKDSLDPMDLSFTLLYEDLD